MTPTIHRPVNGRLLVRIPYSPNNRRMWLDNELRPVWDREVKAWRLSRSRLRDVERILSSAFGSVEVTIDGHASDKCDLRCQSAEGDDCTCSCAGKFHGSKLPGFRLIGETTLIRGEGLTQRRYEVSG